MKGKKIKKIFLVISISIMIATTVSCEKYNDKGNLNATQTVAENRIKPLLVYKINEDGLGRVLDFKDKSLENEIYDIKDNLYKNLMDGYIDQEFSYELILGDISIEFNMESVYDDISKDIYFRLKSNRIVENDDEQIPINNNKSSENYKKKQTDGYIKKDSEIGKKFKDILDKIIANNNTSIEEITKVND